MYDSTSLNMSGTFWNGKSIIYKNNTVPNFYNYEKGTRPFFSGKIGPELGKSPLYKFKKDMYYCTGNKN